MRRFTIFFFCIFFSLIIVVPTFAQKPTAPQPPSTIPSPPVAPEPPEENGDYAVPNHPKIRVRVHAHPLPNAKNNHNATAFILACTPDNDASASVGLEGWKIKSNNWTYRVNTNSIPSSVKTIATTALTNAFATWKNLFSNPSFIQGAQTTATRARFDGQNAILWRSLPNSIATSYMWYYPSTGALVESDLVFNNRYSWSFTSYSGSGSACGTTRTMDVQNIATHEIGHWLGLDDMYGPNDEDLTMHGYADYAELKKDTLTTGDKTAIQSLYSP